MPLQPIDREVVLNLVRAKGPVIPNDLKQQLKLGDTILLGAMLSELASKGQVKISHVKKGGSPYYYDPANPAQLEKAADSLNEKDKRTFELLKEQKVVRDDEHEALTRVSLRNIKDFSMALTVKTEDGDVLYWKYFLVKDKEAEQIIKGEKEPEAATPVTPSLTSITSNATPLSTPSPTVSSTTQSKKPKRPKKEKTSTTTAVTAEMQQQLGVAGTNATSNMTTTPLPSDDFTKKVQAFFDENKIVVIEQKVIKKGELEFVIQMPTPVGPVAYFCKAKAKKANNEGDLAAAKIQGTAKSLPTVYVTNGDLNKRAQEMLANELKGLVVKKL